MEEERQEGKGEGEAKNGGELGQPEGCQVPAPVDRHIVRMPEPDCLGDRFWFVARLVTDMAQSGHRGGTLALLLAAGVLALVVPSIPASAAGGCATPRRDGTASPTGGLHTHHPGGGTPPAAATATTLGHGARA